MLAQEQQELVRSVLRRMSARYREILTRFYLDEQPQEQICQEMGLSDTQFRLLKSRTKARLGKLGKRRLDRSFRHVDTRATSRPHDPRASNIARRESLQDLFEDADEVLVRHLAEEIIDQYVMDRLAPDELADVEEHLLACTECQDAVILVDLIRSARCAHEFVGTVQLTWTLPLEEEASFTLQTSLIRRWWRTLK